MNYSSYYDTAITDYATADLDLDSISLLTGTILASFLMSIIIVAIIVYVLQVVALWKIFTKVGEKGWKSLIPIYNTVILFKISGISPWFVLGYLAVFIPYGSLVVIGINIYQAYALSKSFGKSIGYTIGLFLLPTIFYLILGLGNAEYVGNYVGNNESEI